MSGCRPPIYYDLLFSAWADLEHGNIQRAIVDAAVAAETYMKTIVHEGLPSGLDEPVRNYIDRAQISRVHSRFFPARLNAAQRERYSALKPVLTQLFDERNDIMHSGRKEGVTADCCKTLVRSVSELISLWLEVRVFSGFAAFSTVGDSGFEP